MQSEIRVCGRASPAVPGAGDAVSYTHLDVYKRQQSEIAFCKRLLLGETIAEAAEKLGITQGTVRRQIL